MELSDERLMQRIRSGDQEAFACLMRRYRGPLFSYLVRMTANAADAEDAYQETFLRVFQHAARFRAGAPFRPWLYRIATNCCRDLMRKRRRRKAFGDSAAEGQSAPLTEGFADPGPNPRESAARRETADEIASAVAALPHKQRAVFLMARYNKMAYPEIAQALGVPVGTVKSRMNTATKRLIETLRGTEL